MKSEVQLGISNNAIMTDKSNEADTIVISSSALEQKVRIDLAACYRLMHEYGMVEMIANHITCRVPGTTNEFLINPYGMLFDEITASSLIRMNINGQVLSNNTEYGVNPAGYLIHTAIYEARPDVNAIIHSHTLANMAVSAMECGLLPLAQTSMRWARGLSYHDYTGIIIDDREKESLQKNLGHNDGMILRNHGVLVTASSIPECFNAAFRLERACEVQVLALSCNTKLVYPNETIIDATYKMFQPSDSRRRRGLLEWPALLRRLDRIDPGYRE